MAMNNFSPEFQTPEQYIIDITYIIWEESGIGRINDWYAADCPRYSPKGISHSAAEVIHDTLEAKTIFPDREIYAEDVIIGDMASGFYSSHRARSVGTHLGDSYYGSATNRRITKLTIADCVCRDNKIVEEWELADQAGIVRQMGLDPIIYGKNLGVRFTNNYSVGNEMMRQRWSDPKGLISIGNREIADRIIRTYHTIWNEKNMSTMSNFYDRAIRFEGPDNRLIYGRSNICKMFTSILTSIPDGNFEPHHIIVSQKPNLADRIALRWSYCGTHSGYGCYGEPTGSPVAILGISHFELRGGLIANEWMVIDETSIYAQISAH